MASSLARILVASSVVLAATLPAAARSATVDTQAAPIVLNTSIAGVKLGATEKTIRATLGKPERRIARGNGVIELRYVGVAYLLKRDRALILTSTSKTLPTDRGVGYGSSRAQLIRAYPSCEKQLKDPVDDCVLGKTARKGQDFTVFTVQKNRVTLVNVARLDELTECLLGCG